MIDRLSRLLLQRVLRVPATPERFDVCLYGLSLLLYTMISSAGLMAIGMAMHHTIGAFLMMVTYYLNQSFGGGFHGGSRCWSQNRLHLFTAVGSRSSRFLALAIVFHAKDSTPGLITNNTMVQHH